jgi:flagellar transcriptional activator FlhC
MRSKSLLTEAKQIERAVTLIHLGARLQVLESETDMSYERLLRLYKEVAGKSPSKGQLPFSTDWFMTWQPNIHASLFLNIHEYLNKASEIDEIDIVIKAYQLYLEQTQTQGLEPLLSVTRAWRLVKFIDNGMLTLTKCSKCGGHFVTHHHEVEPPVLEHVQGHGAVFGLLDIVVADLLEETANNAAHRGKVVHDQKLHVGIGCAHGASLASDGALRCPHIELHDCLSTPQLTS